MNKREAVLKQYERALGRFQSMLQREQDEAARDSSILRFEFTLDLAWKAIKAYLEEVKGLSCRSPKDCIRIAFQEKIVEYDDFWLEMVDMRNEIVHSYNEDFARELHGKLPRTLPLFHGLLKNLSQTDLKPG